MSTDDYKMSLVFTKNSAAQKEMSMIYPLCKNGCL